MNKFRLQIKHHSEIFASRELAVEYINNNFKTNSLIAEPSLFLYGAKDTVKPNAILVFGAGENKISIIDINNVEEGINKIENITTLQQQELKVIENDIQSLISACGLSFNVDKNNNRITYAPNIDDEVLRKAKDITEAITLLSTHIQNELKQNKLSIENTNTLVLDITQNSDGTTIFGNVKISTHGISDESDVNDNIIIVKEDGLYAAADLDYDPIKRTLTFTSSGVKNNTMKDDAKKKVFELGEHTVYTPQNDGHNVELIVNKIDSFNSNISADVKLSEDINNILVKKDGKLLAEGVSNNIKHNDTTVADALNLNTNNINVLSKGLEDEIARAVVAESELGNNIDVITKNVASNNTYIAAVEGNLTNYKNEVELKFADQNQKLQEYINNNTIQGVGTNTIIIESQKGVNDKGYQIKGDVLLSNDKSIIVSEGGLSANINVKVDAHNNKLIVNIGDKVIEQDLPGVNLIESIVYDQKAHTIVITFSNGKVATIPVDDLLEDFTFNNISEEPVALETSNNTDGSVNVAARLKLRSEDNILAVENGLLYASKSAIDNAISVETSRAQSKENEIITKIDTAVADLFVNIQSNSNLVNTESERAKLAESEIEKLIVESNTLFSSEIGNLNTKVSKTEENINTNTTRINEINVSFQALSDEVEAEVLRSKAVEAQLQNDINSEIERAINEETLMKTTITNNSESIVALNTKVDNIKNDINIINGSVETKGSILEIVTHSQEDTLLQAKVYTDTVADTKANVNDVYTKSECDEKFLTEHQDISHLATKEEVNEVKEILTIKVDKTELDRYATTKYVDEITDDLSNEVGILNTKTNLIDVNENMKFVVNGNEYTSINNAIESINNGGNTDLSEIYQLIQEMQTKIKSLEDEISSLKQQTKIDSDIATALSVLTGVNEEIFTDNEQTLDKEDIQMSIDSGEYGNE